MPDDPIEAQLQERLVEITCVELTESIEADAEKLERLAADLARECAALRRLCLRAAKDDFQDLDLDDDLEAAANGEEVRE